ncbi:flavodoxin domain-containing protein, partial [Pseudomonas viridiflava]|uniref:flavodoxin domain-containing protein n=1 Tax=Pseudomonas viridiflava TaxID=33069 RepID=UPI0039770D8E
MRIAIVCGSVYGSAEEVARNVGGLLRAAGHETLLNPGITLPELLAFEPQALLAVTSTTGMGGLPDNIMPIYSQLRDRLPAALRGLPGG